MSWDALPFELLPLILAFRREMLRKDACEIALKRLRDPREVRWFGVGFDAPADFLLVGLGDYGAMNPDLADVLEFCVEVLSSKESPELWNPIFEHINYALWVDQYSGGPGAVYYNRTHAAFETLIKRFGYIVRPSLSDSG